MNALFLLLFCYMTCVHADPPKKGPYSTSSKVFTYTGLDKTDDKIHVFYPSNGTTGFPLISYTHGAAGGPARRGGRGVGDHDMGAGPAREVHRRLGQDAGHDLTVRSGPEGSEVAVQTSHTAQHVMVRVVHRRFRHAQSPHVPAVRWRFVHPADIPVGTDVSSLKGRAREMSRRVACRGPTTSGSRRRVPVLRPDRRAADAARCRT